ncbi:FecR family protein [Robertkochia solimangrovi]|uniref:FecR family protein n=1 Tax=Robertkochia solimangrovi TaxID=2213046 RepID=UPI00117D7C64|nr:FecR domain-containing protein [Robertkochia solimangrovi]TRZ43195.1 hypothetical protein DMZ48_10915 [Robertkochia solimangrovi]
MSTMNSELLFRYLNGEANENEVEEIFEWIEMSEVNRAEFIRLKKAWAIGHRSDSAKKASAGKIIQIAKKRTARKLEKRFLKYASVAVIAGALFVWNLTEKDSNIPVEKVNNVVLELPDGNTRELISNDTLFLNGQAVATFSKDSIIYQDNQDQIEFNIKVPFEKTYAAVLPDGTKVMLNAGSELRYFQSSGDSLRRTSLIGEAFFDVARNEAVPFVVHTEDIDVRVLGTHFNVMAYTEMVSAEITLTEGSVKVSANSETKDPVYLEPGEIAQFDKTTGLLSKRKVSDLDHLSWRYGTLTMHQMESKILFEFLERYFGVDIKIENSAISQSRFSGELNLKDQSLPEILEILKLDTPFDYQVNGSVINLTKPN